MHLKGLPWWLGGKESACISGDMGSIPGWGRKWQPPPVWEIPWTEEPGGLQSTGSQESDTT